MQLDLDFGFDQIAKELIRGIIDSVSDQAFPSMERKAAAQQTVACTVMAYQPRDPVEIMMAGHCIVYDHMLRDGARDMLRGQADEVKIKARPGVLSTGKMFLATLAMLNRMQGRCETGLAFARRPPAVVPPPAKPAEPAPAVTKSPRESTKPNRPAVPSRESVTVAQPVPAETAVPDPSSVSSSAPTPVAATDVTPAVRSVEPPVAPETDQHPLETHHDDPAAAFAEFVAPGKIEELFLNGLTPKEKEHVREVFARTAQAAE